MKLIDHLKSKDRTVADFAHEIGESVNTVRKIVYGQRQPSLSLAVKIAEASGGEVAPADLLIPPTDVPPPPIFPVTESEEATSIPRHELRPDIFPPPASSESEAA